MEYAIHRVMSDTDYNANKEEEQGKIRRLCVRDLSPYIG